MDNDKVEEEYPKSNMVWKGIPKNIDAAFTSTSNGGKYAILKYSLTHTKSY